MAKTKGKSSSKKVSQVVQCPHLHFKTDIIDRNVLSKEQHLNLLSTPKGYRWEEYKKEGGDDGETAEEPFSTRRIMCSGRRMKKAEKVYVHNFLAEVWNLLTPEMVDRLKGMLMNEFGMSPQEADDFISKQREENIKNSSTVSFYKKPRDIGEGKYVYDHVIKMRPQNQAQCDKLPKANLGVRNAWIKHFSDHLSDMMSSYVLETMCAGRNVRQQEIAQTLLNRFNTLLEQKATMSDPKTPTDKTMVLVADRLATWLDNNIGVSKEASQKIKAITEAEQKKKMEEDRKRRQEEMKRMRYEREAAEKAERLEKAEELEGDEQVHELDHEKGVAHLVEDDGEEQDEFPTRPEESSPVEHQPMAEGEQPGGETQTREEGDAQRVDQEPPKEETAHKADVNEPKQQEEKKEDEGPTPMEQQRVEEELEQKAVGETPIPEPAAPEAERQGGIDEQQKAEQEAADSNKPKTEEVQEGVQQRTGEVKQQKATEREKAEQEAEIRQTIMEEQKEAEQKALEGEEQRAGEEPKIKEEGDARELEKQSKDEKKNKLDDKREDEAAAGLEPDKDGSEKPIIRESSPGPSEEPTKPSNFPVSEPPPSDEDGELVKLLPTEVSDKAKPSTKVEESPVDEIKPIVTGPQEKGLSPEEKEKRTNEVLKSVASIILDTKVDPSPRQEALKDIMEKHFEENLGDQDKEAIDKVSAKIGTWIDKIVDQASLEYGERESSRPPSGVSEGIWAPATSRGQPPVLGPGGAKILSRVPDVTGTPAEPSRGPGVTGVPTGHGLIAGAPGAYRVPGDSTTLGKPASGPGTVEPGPVPAVMGAHVTGEPRMRAPVSQRPKGRIYSVGRTDSDGFDVEMISNNRAQEKIRLARGKSPAFDDVPNPEEPMEPSDMRKWYKWTSALTEVAESWAEWIKGTIKGTQQRGEDMITNNSPELLNEWRDFKNNQINSARKWQQTKKEMERRAELWNKKRRRVQSQ